MQYSKLYCISLIVIFVLLCQQIRAPTGSNSSDSDEQGKEVKDKITEKLSKFSVVEKIDISKLPNNEQEDFKQLVEIFKTLKNIKFSKKSRPDLSRQVRAAQLEWEKFKELSVKLNFMTSKGTTKANPESAIELKDLLTDLESRAAVQDEVSCDANNLKGAILALKKIAGIKSKKVAKDEKQKSKTDIKQATEKVLTPAEIEAYRARIAFAVNALAGPIDNFFEKLVKKLEKVESGVKGRGRRRKRSFGDSCLGRIIVWALSAAVYMIYLLMGVIMCASGIVFAENSMIDDGCGYLKHEFNFWFNGIPRPE